MKGNTGPFNFTIDDYGHKVRWQDLDEAIRNALNNSVKTHLESRDVFCFSISISGDTIEKKYYDWSKVQLVAIEVKKGTGAMTIIGIYPVTMPNVYFFNNIFDMQNYKIRISPKVMSFINHRRLQIITECSRNQAKWLYTNYYEECCFKLFFYVALPKLRDGTVRCVEVSIKPILKNHKPLNAAAVNQHTVIFS